MIEIINGELKNMKTYAIVGNQYEGLYTQPWSTVQKYTQTKPAPRYKGFTSASAAQSWFDEQKNSQDLSSRKYSIAYDGQFKTDPEKYYLFTDGGSRNTGNVAGGHVKATDKAAWALAIYRGNNLTEPLFQAAEAFFGRTNNEMEILAVIHSLEQAQKVTAPVVIVSDSKYVLDSVTNWMHNWKAAGWKKSTGTIANLELWQKVDQLLQPIAERLEFIWVKGHATSAGNVLVDRLLNEAMDQLK
ncbi:ribonuclease H family protein [Weissella coleopterorum]|nr:ribonuclease H [Weissella coleopterorum]